jgi:hypothetical protein
VERADAVEHRQGALHRHAGIDIGNIISSYTLAQGATVGGTIIPNGSNSAVLGGSLSFSNSPTITYTPLTGNAYIKGLITPLPAPIVFAAIQNGLPADSTLLTSIASIKGLRNQMVTLQGIRPADADFHRVRELMREIQISAAIRLYVKDDGKNQTSVLGLRTNDVPPEIQAASKELRVLLRLNPDATEFTLVSTPLPANVIEVAVMTRSISAMIQNMAAQVEVPSRGGRAASRFSRRGSGARAAWYRPNDSHPQFEKQTE